MMCEHGRPGGYLCPHCLGPFSTPVCEVCGKPVREGLRYCPGLSECWRIGEGVTGMRWNREMPSRAVVASDGHDGVLLWWVGSCLAGENEAGLRLLSDLGLDDAPSGVSIWEGRYTWEEAGPYDSREVESSPKGTFREPTEAEWVFIEAGRAPWNENEWRCDGDDEP